MGITVDLNQFSLEISRFAENSKHSDARIFALYQRMNLRTLIFASPNEFDLSTIWSQRLLHSNLLLNCICKFHKNKLLKVNAFHASEALNSFSHPTNAGGQSFMLASEQTVAAHTLCTQSLCASSSVSNPRSFSGNTLTFITDAVYSSVKDNVAKEIIVDATEKDMDIIAEVTSANLIELPLFNSMKLDELKLSGFYGSENPIFPAELPALQFWTDWYEGLLSGTPVDWRLQQKLALIQNSEFEKGSKYISNKFETIVLQEKLKNKIEALEFQLENLRPILAVSDRQHNHPPEPIIDEKEVLSSEVEKTLEKLDDLKQEVSKDKPSVGTLRTLLSWLQEESLRIAKYIGGVVDTAIQSVAKRAGETVVALALTIENFDKIGEFVLELINRLLL